MNISSGIRQIPPVTKNLLILNILVWLVLQFLPQATLIRVENLFALHYFTSHYFNPIQLVTGIFMHVDFMHLFFNMFALYMFGNWVERVIQPKRFVFYYLSCGIGASLIQLGAFAVAISHYGAQLPAGAVSLIAELPVDVSDPYTLLMAMEDNGLGTLLQANDALNQFSINYIFEIYSLINVPVIGASGAVYGILLAFGFIFPKAPIYLFFVPIPIQARWLVVGYGALELLQGLANRTGDNVAHFAHLGGMIFGLMMLLYWRKKGLFKNGLYF